MRATDRHNNLKTVPLGFFQLFFVWWPSIGKTVALQIFNRSTLPIEIFSLSLSSFLDCSEIRNLYLGALVLFGSSVLVLLYVIHIVKNSCLKSDPYHLAAYLSNHCCKAKTGN